ncbi:MAG: PEP-CTERM sorting domain-containing protein [Pirellulales bacterium]|nr:PEP-CTERM sorting domain-containing protein [Pirellulales bacterium]
MTLNRLALFFCATLALTAGATAEAALFFSDHFNYANGDLTVYDGTGDNVSNGAWAPYSGTGNTPSIEVVGGQAKLLIDGSEDATRSIPNAVTDFMTAGETWYYSARVTVNDRRATPATTAIQNDYFMLMKDTGTTNFRSRLYVNNPSTGTGGAGFRFGIGPSSGAANAVNWGTDLAFGTTYDVVASYSFDDGFVRLWVNPATQASTSVQATASPSPGTFITDLSLRQGFITPNEPNTEILIDAVGFGDNFGEVLTALTIPEPASVALSLAGLAGLISMGRRRRR